MVDLKHRQQLPLSYNWRLQAFPKGTVKLGIYLDTARPDGSFSLKGNLIIPTAPPAIVRRGKNLIVTVGKALVADMLKDTAGYDTGLTYQAFGTNAGAPTLADTLLGTEAGRKAVTVKSRVANVVTWSTFFTAGESTFFLKEGGIFGHSTATAAANSGILFSHWLVSFDNSGALYDITLDYVLTIG